MNETYLQRKRASIKAVSRGFNIVRHKPAVEPDPEPIPTRWRMVEELGIVVGPTVVKLHVHGLTAHSRNRENRITLSAGLRQGAPA